MTCKKILKIIAGIVAIVLLIGILWFANGLLGNPISKALAARTAKQHIAETYPEMELAYSAPQFDFKSGGYWVTVTSPTSIDTHFTMDFNAWGKLVNDRYEYSVLELDNTRRRIDDTYRQQVDAVFDDPSFPYVSYIGYGELHDLPTDGLSLDMGFDVTELGRADGHIVIYVEDAVVTAQRAAEILLDLTQILDDNDVGFASIDFELIKPRIDDQPNPDDTRFGVSRFLYADIYADGLVTRLRAAADELNAYYAEQDAEKNAEIAQLDN